MKNTNSAEQLFIEYLLVTPDRKKILNFEQRKYLFLSAIRDYLHNETDLKSFSQVCEYLYSFSDLQEDNISPVRRHFNDLLESASDMHFYFTENKKSFGIRRNGLHEYYEENKHILEK